MDSDCDIEDATENVKCWTLQQYNAHPCVTAGAIGCTPQRQLHDAKHNVRRYIQSNNEGCIRAAERCSMSSQMLMISKVAVHAHPHDQWPAAHHIHSQYTHSTHDYSQSSKQRHCSMRLPVTVTHPTLPKDGLPIATAYTVATSMKVLKNSLHRARKHQVDDHPVSDVMTENACDMCLPTSVVLLLLILCNSAPAKGLCLADACPRHKACHRCRAHFQPRLEAHLQADTSR